MLAQISYSAEITRQRAPEWNSKMQQPAIAKQVIVADDHPLFRSAMREALMQTLPDCEIVEAESALAVQTAVQKCLDADLCLLDLHMPGGYGFSTLAFLRGQFPGLPVVIVSATEDPGTMQRAIALGASGYIPKSLSVADIAVAIQAVLRGDIWLPPQARGDVTEIDADEHRLADALAELTPQQFRVLTMVADGLLNKQIGYELDVSEATVKAHMTAILRKLGVSNRTAAVIACQKLDALDQDARLGSVD